MATPRKQSREFTESYLWPNDAGYTPCTPEYLVAIYALEDHRRDFGFDLEGMSPSDYEARNRLEDTVMGLIYHGHLGKPVRFDSK